MNILDLSSALNQDRVFYVPRLEDDIEQSIVPENMQTDTEGKRQVQAEVKPESAPPEMVLDMTNDQNAVDDDFALSQSNVFYVPKIEEDIEQSIVRENMETGPEGGPHVQTEVKPEFSSQEMVLAEAKDQNAVDDDFALSQSNVFYVPKIEEDIEQSIVRENMETGPEGETHVQTEVKPEFSSPEMVLAEAKDQNVTDDGVGAAMESISVEDVANVEVKDGHNEPQISKVSLTMRSRNQLSNCNLI